MAAWRSSGLPRRLLAGRPAVAGGSDTKRANARDWPDPGGQGQDGQRPGAGLSAGRSRDIQPWPSSRQAQPARWLEPLHPVTNLGNLAAGEPCTITLRYAQTLQFEQRRLRLLIPTVIAPRYGDALQHGGLMPHQVPSHSLTADYSFELELRLHGELSQARAASPSHPVGIAHVQEGASGVLTVSLSRRAALDRDFVLVVDQIAHDSMAVVARDCVEPERVAILASFCPRIPAQGSTATAVKILVDCSGSMAGDSIAAAKRALQANVF